MYYSKKIKDSSQAANLMRGHLEDLDHEELWALFLTSANTLIEAEMLTKGTLSATLIDSRTVVKRAHINNAASVIILHNHPSGEACPSLNDIRQTASIRSACNLLDISLLDHIILAGKRYYSFAEDGSFEFDPNDPPFIK